MYGRSRAMKKAAGSTERATSATAAGSTAR